MQVMVVTIVPAALRVSPRTEKSYQLNWRSERKSWSYHYSNQLGHSEDSWGSKETCFDSNFQLEQGRKVHEQNNNNNNNNNETYKLLGDFEILLFGLFVRLRLGDQTDHLISAWRTDQIIVNNKKKNLPKCGLADHRVKLKESEKRDK